MRYEIQFKPRAVRDFKALTSRIQARVLARIEEMSDGLKGDVKRLTDVTPEYRLRIGDYRVLFEIEDGLFRLTGRSRRMEKSGKRKTVEQYLKLQERFRHITPEQVDHLQAWVDNRWEQFRQRHHSSHHH